MNHDPKQFDLAPIPSRECLRQIQLNSTVPQIEPPAPPPPVENPWADVYADIAVFDEY